MKSQFARHPYLSLFVLLAIGMQVVLYLGTRSVALATSQYAAFALATVALAALCVWILTWEK